MSFQAPDLAALPRYPIIIGDAREERGSGAVMPHVYPGNGRVTREIAMANAQDVDRAVMAARAAFPGWRALPGDQRRNLMFKLAALFEARSAEFAPSLIAENGSISAYAPFMGYDAAQKFRYFGGWADKIHGRTVPMWGAPAHDYVTYEPYGVVGAIIPWNGPLFAATMVLAPALATGNCVVLKSPDLAPYSAMKLVELILEAGFPPGVVNLVTGAADVGEAMVAHPGIDKIEFIGSGATAKKVLASAAQSLKPVGLELGGKSAVIVFDDADLASATKCGVSGAVSANGQGCVNGTRLLVQRGIYDQFCQMLAATANHIAPGDPMDPATMLGPVISEGALSRILGMVEGGVNEGGRVIAGGQRMGGDHAPGYFLPVTVLADVPNASHIAQNEVFGPVLVVTPFDTEEEAIALANGYRIRAWGLCPHPEPAPCASCHRPASGGHDPRQRLGRGDAAQLPVRRLEKERPRAARRHRGAQRIHATQEYLDVAQGTGGLTVAELLDPIERSGRGAALQAEVTGSAAAPSSPLEASIRDFVMAEVWNRPGLERRARYLISIAGCAMTATAPDIFDRYVAGALQSGLLSLAELREGALHMAVYGGWGRGEAIDKAVSRAAQKLGLPPADSPPIRAEAWDPEVRTAQGMEEFTQTMTFPGGPSASPFLEAINNFVFGEMWCRRGLDQRSRRFMTLVGVAESAAEVPIKSHFHAAMASGNCTADELQEFVLHYGLHAGWPKASLVQGIVSEMAKKVEAGLPWNG